MHRGFEPESALPQVSRLPQRVEPESPHPEVSRLPQRVEPESPRAEVSRLPQRVEPESPLAEVPRLPYRSGGQVQYGSAASALAAARPEEATLPASSGPAVQDPLQASAPVSTLRSETEAAFPACPGHFLSRARALGASAAGPPESRILRAWRAGCWAREVLRGNYPTPSASVRLDIPSRVYPVLGGPGVQPAVYRAYRDVARVLGPLSSSRGVFHGFPSETEAEVYVVAAGLQWPL